MSLVRSDSDDPSPAEPLAGLAASLRAALGNVAETPEPPTLLFSGGVDSVLLAWLMRTDPRTLLATVGLPGSFDLGRAHEASRILAMPWRPQCLSLPGLQKSWNGWGRALWGEPEPRRSVLFSLGVAFESFPRRAIWLGQGADELFGGYAHFDGLGVEECQERARRDLQRLREVDWPRTMELARDFGVSLRAPYLDERFEAEVESLPSRQRFGGGGRKPLLRKLASYVGVPEPLASGPKKAMQYGSGISKAVAGFSRATRAGAPPH
jgi:asparagine synthase (glutamine-hydrolysing)